MSLTRWLLGDVLAAVNSLRSEVMPTLDDIKNAIAGERAEEDKIVALLQQMKTSNDDLQKQLAAAIANSDPAAMQAIADQLAANSKAMDDAVSAIQNPPQPAPQASSSTDPGGSVPQHGRSPRRAAED